MKKTVKKILSVMLILTMVLSAPLTGLAGLDLNVLSNAEDGALAAHGQCGDNVYWDFDESAGELVLNGTGRMTDYYNFRDTCPFANNESIKKVFVGSGITDLCEEAFCNCTEITDVIIGEDVKYIRNRAFYNCKELKSITIPSSVLVIQRAAFYDCENLSSVLLNEGLVEIWNNAFANCESLSKLVIPNSVKKIDGNAFNNSGYYNRTVNWDHDVLYNGDWLICAKESLTGEYRIKDNTKLIADYAFSDCKYLTEILIPYSVESVGAYTFSYCSSLTKIEVENIETAFSDSVFFNTAFYFDETNWENESLYINSTLININPKFSGNYSVKQGTTHIAGGAFKNCELLESVDVPNSVKSIGENAFYRCYELTNITIPNSVETIGTGAFIDCRKLTSIDLPNNIINISKNMFYNCRGLSEVILPENLKYIGEYAFYECSSLKEISFPDSLLDIGDAAFSFCTGINDVVLPQKINSISDLIFAGCDNLQYVIITGRVTHIGYDSFCGCEKLMSINIPESVVGIGRCAFSGCYNLNGLIIPNGVEYIGESAFYKLKDIQYSGNASGYPWGAIDSSEESDDTALFNFDYPESGKVLKECNSNASGEIIIPNDVDYIGDYAFAFCEGITSIIIPDSVTSIGDSAFYRCTSLTSITIPDSVTRIGEWAFRGCTGLSSIKVSSGNKVYDSRNNCNAIIETETNTLIRGCENTIIPDDVTSLGDYAFDGCTSLISITIPNGVTSIGDYAFNDCTELTSMKISDSLTSIGSYAFSCCTNLTNITIPDGVTSIGDYAFWICTGLTSITIPDSVTYIGESAFYLCSGLINITVDKNNRVYDSRNNCNAIIKTATNTLLCGFKDTIIPDGITSIGDKAFLNCTDLKSIDIPDSVTNIGNYAFYNCTGLTSITIGNRVTSIGKYAFYNCSCVTNITIPNSVTSINDCTFEYCTGLTSIEIPDNVMSIGDSAFRDCTSLISITIPDSVTNIGEYAFYYCSSLKYVYYSGTPEQWKKITVAEYNEDLLSASVLYKHIIKFDFETKILSINGFDTFEKSDSYPWDAYKDEIRYIEIDNDITAIPEGAFESCPNLDEVYIGKNVTSIGDRAFANCPNLSVVTITSPSVDIAGNAFDGGNSRLMFIVNEDNMGIKTYCIFHEIPYIAWSLAKYNETISFSGEFVMYGNLDYSFIHKMIEDNRYLKYIHFDTVTFDGVNNNQLIVLGDDSSVGVVQNAEYTTLTNANISTSVKDENGETHQVSFNDMFKMAEKGEYEQFNIRLESNEGVWEKIIDFVEKFYTAALSSISRLINTIARYIKKK